MNRPPAVARAAAAAFRAVPPIRGRARIEALFHRWLRDRDWSDVVGVNGGEMEVLLDDLIGRSIYVNGIWERPNTVAMRMLARPGDVAFDVGANSGYYSLLLSTLVGASGRVYGFEPIPATRELLLRNLARNEATNVEVVPIALSSEPGSVQMNVTATRNTGASHVVAASVDEPFRAGILETLTIQCSTADAFWESVGRPPVRLVKIDIEGHEFHAIRGMRQLLASSSRTIVMVEVRDSFLRAAGASAAELFDFLRALGYGSYDFDVRRRRFIRNDATRNGELICFAREAL
jgi:FkbM family methyltransferase